MQEYSLLETLLPFSDDPEVSKVNAFGVCNVLSALNPQKASSPDGIPNWFLHKYADFLCDPIWDILNTSFAEQKLPSSWRYAGVLLLLKEKPVTIVSKHIRPILLTPALSKLAEDLTVSNYVGPAVLELIDQNQSGTIPKSSTLQALISVVHTWVQATDGTGSAVRVMLLDYSRSQDNG